MQYPADEERFTIDEYGDPFSFRELSGEGNFFGARWSFVVTNDLVQPYLTLVRARGVVSDDRAHDYQLVDGEWQVGGWSACGFEGGSIDTFGETFPLSWVANCSP